MKVENITILRSLILFGLCLLVFAGTAKAQVTVACPDENLQAAVNNSNNTTITVTGTCSECILIGPAKTLVLTGGGSAVINCQNSTVAAVQVYGRLTGINGFTIQGGLDGIAVSGGGTSRISGNVIENSARHGIATGQCGMVWALNNTIQGHPGAGIAVYDTSTARIGVSYTSDTVAQPNTIQNNLGSGILVARSSSAVIVGNTVTGNGGDGITVERVSQANISSNTINDNDGNGIQVATNSGINLGNDTGTTIYDTPNQTTTKNAKAGIKCSLGAYVDGRRGTLNGKKGTVTVLSGCINGISP